jgi:hypothetical protein
VISEDADDSQIPGNLQDDISVSTNIFHMKNHRRMRSKELHYIDHPLVGMLIQINPVVKPKNEVEDATSQS